MSCLFGLRAFGAQPSHHEWKVLEPCPSVLWEVSFRAQSLLLIPKSQNPPHTHTLSLLLVAIWLTRTGFSVYLICFLQLIVAMPYDPSQHEGRPYPWKVGYNCEAHNELLFSGEAEPSAKAEDACKEDQPFMTACKYCYHNRISCPIHGPNPCQHRMQACGCFIGASSSRCCAEYKFESWARRVTSPVRRVILPLKRAASF